MEKVIIGLEKDAIPTPALLIDLEKMEYNISKMADFCRGKKINLRPHIKTHKTPLIAHEQIEAGAIGITCQNLAEAEVMAEAGIKDILISNEIIDIQKIKRLVNLAKYARTKVCVDSSKNIEDISQAAKEKRVRVGILVEVNIGMDRCGVSPGEPTLRLAQEVERQKNLEFLGLMGYEGHTVLIKSYEKRKRKTEEALGLLVDTKKLLEERGLECKIVSAGGTGTYEITGSYSGITEIQPGSYVTMDTAYESIEDIGEEFEQALSLLTMVMSKPVDDRAILEGGIKAISIDMGIPKIASNKGIRIDQLHEEHTLVKLKSGTKEQLKVGQKVELIPSHGCTTISLHDYFYGIRNGIVELIGRIEARGKF